MMANPMVVSVLGNQNALWSMKEFWSSSSGSDEVDDSNKHTPENLNLEKNVESAKGVHNDSENDSTTLTDASSKRILNSVTNDIYTNIGLQSGSSVHCFVIPAEPSNEAFVNPRATSSSACYNTTISSNVSCNNPRASFSIPCGNAPFICGICSSPHHTLRSLQHHKRSIHSVKLRSCLKCDETFVSQFELDKHVAIKRHYAGWYCFLCQKNLRNIHEFMNHSCHNKELGSTSWKNMAIQSGVSKNAWQCRFCYKTFWGLHAFKAHQITCNFTCILCNKVCENFETFFTHTEECKKKNHIPTVQDLLSNGKIVTNLPQVDSKLVSNNCSDAVVTCQLCKKLFISIDAIKNHECIYHKEKLSNITPLCSLALNETHRVEKLSSECSKLLNNETNKTVNQFSLLESSEHQISYSEKLKALTTFVQSTTERDSKQSNLTVINRAKKCILKNTITVQNLTINNNFYYAAKSEGSTEASNNSESVGKNMDDAVISKAASPVHFMQDLPDMRKLALPETYASFSFAQAREKEYISINALKTSLKQNTSTLLLKNSVQVINSKNKITEQQNRLVDSVSFAKTSNELSYGSLVSIENSEQINSSRTVLSEPQNGLDESLNLLLADNSLDDSDKTSKINLIESDKMSVAWGICRGCHVNFVPIKDGKCNVCYKLTTKLQTNTPSKCVTQESSCENSNQFVLSGVIDNSNGKHHLTGKQNTKIKQTNSTKTKTDDETSVSSVKCKRKLTNEKLSPILATPSKKQRNIIENGVALKARLRSSSANSTKKSDFHCSYCALQFANQYEHDEHICCLSDDELMSILTSFSCHPQKEKWNHTNKKYPVNACTVERKAKSKNIELQPLLPASDEIQEKFHCTRCSAVFPYQRLLDWHVRTHDEHRPHICQICKSRFKRISNLKEHWRFFHLKGRVPCMKCDKVFPTSIQLREHSRIHTTHYKFVNRKVNRPVNLQNSETC